MNCQVPPCSSATETNYIDVLFKQLGKVVPNKQQRLAAKLRARPQALISITETLLRGLFLRVPFLE